MNKIIGIDDYNMVLVIVKMKIMIGNRRRKRIMKIVITVVVVNKVMKTIIIIISDCNDN